MRHRNYTGPFDENVRKFLPPVLFEWPGFTDAPAHDATTLFVDIAGFTRLSEDLAARGPEGAELLEGALARYFDALLAVVEPLYGLPAKVSGDAITILFPVLQDDWQDAAQRAVRAADRLRHMGQNVFRLQVDGVEYTLAHKIGVGAGRLISAEVGDPALNTELIFFGPTLDDAVKAEHMAHAGEVWVSPLVARWVQADAQWDAGRPEHFRRLAATPQLRLEQTPLAPPPRRVPDERRVEIQSYRSMIPRVVQAHAAQGTLTYISRHQPLTIMFAGWEAEPLNSPAAIPSVDAFYRHMQTLVEEHGGFLSEFEAGDKGAKLIVLFGAPTMLEDPITQAVRCAQAMRMQARGLSQVRTLRIGLTAGRLFVGQIGCSRLVKYSAVGDRMNLAARLMSQASRWMVLAERSIVEHCQQGFRWGKARQLQIKGKEETIVAHPLLVPPARTRMRHRAPPLLGRHPERLLLLQLVLALEKGRGGLLRLYGPVGIGKTRLLNALVQLVSRRPALRLIRWNELANRLEQGPLSPFRPLLLELIGADALTAPERLEPLFRRWHDQLPVNLQDGAASLASLVGIPWTVTPTFAQLPPDRQLRFRQRSLADCLLQSCRETPYVFIIDAADRLDSASSSVLADLAPNLAQIPLLVAVAQRPLPDQRLETTEQVHVFPNNHQVTLQPFGVRDMRRLALRQLQVKGLDPELESFLFSRSRGLPLQLESWIDVLRAGDHIRIVNQTACLEGVERMQALPDQLEALILAQVERLPLATQLTLRVASVIGQAMTPAELAALHPEHWPERVVQSQLLPARQLGVLVEDELTHRLFFSLGEILDALHGGLPFQLRRQLHQQRASQLLATRPEPLDPQTVLVLARHHEYAQDAQAQRAWFGRALAICRERYDHRGTMHWGRLLISLSRRLEDAPGLLDALNHVQNALGWLGENAEREKLLQQWIQEAERHDQRSLVEALQVRARLQQRSGRVTEASIDIERAIQVARTLADAQALFHALIYASTVYDEAGHTQRALEVVAEAEACVGPHDRGGRFKLLMARGVVLRQAGRSKEALEDWQQALTLCDPTALWDRGMVLGNLGLLLWSAGQPEPGHQHILQSLEIKRQVGDRREIAISILNVGYSCFQLGELALARQHAAEACRLMAQLNYVRGEVTALSNFGEVQLLTDHPGDARQAFEQAETLLKSYPHEPLQIELKLRWGELLLQENNAAQALAHFTDAQPRARTAHLLESECAAWEGIAESQRRLKALDEAQSAMLEAQKLYDQQPQAAAFPCRLWWRVTCLARDRGELEVAERAQLKAWHLLNTEQQRLSSRAARNRLARAFPWNREILETRSLGTRERA